MGVAITLQQTLYNRLSTADMFNGNMSANAAAIPIVQEIKGDITNEVQTALAKLGICVVLLVPVFQLFDQYLWSLGGWMFCNVDVFEHVPLNETTTKVKAPDICEQTVRLMQRWPVGQPPSWLYNTNGEPSYFRGLPTPWRYVSVGPPVHYVVQLQVNVLLPPNP